MMISQTCTLWLPDYLEPLQMIWCANCTRYQPGDSTKLGLISCGGCGKVVDQSVHSEEAASTKDAATQLDKAKRILDAGKDARSVIKKTKGDNGVHEVVDCVDNRMHRNDHVSAKRSGKSDMFSGINDAEIASYLLSEGEMRLKKILWERINQGYLKEQAAKKHVSGSRDVNLSKYHNDSEEMSVGDGTKSKKQKQSTNRKAVGAAPQMSNKNFSSKINYDKLEELLGQSMALHSPKKRRRESQTQAEDGVMSKTSASVGDMFAEFEAVEEYEEDEGNVVDKNCFAYYGGVDQGNFDGLF
ncbi:hypothetical protein Dimus_024007 [Dionaea muscipula]